jgi:hypothetical protein
MCCHLQHRHGKEVIAMREVFSFISSVIAGIVASIVCKWLDRRGRKR